ncbi:MAG: cysteine-rich CWC family protein [Zoogloea sp.]|uniref:cysteine-rich CWC family protein n=1 Tax=Zoogloea sp. TaxID=49181 RepID=UPI0026277439|nr:cysteine-rich CWC family protein [Zoogloea sp.]MDD2989200.1 cysteine-rich CWC family protein [Zoogloea sp.]
MERRKDEAGRNICPACGAAFTCGMEAGLAECWCASLPPVLAVPEAHAGQCYCPACLRQRIESALTPPR